MAKQAPHAGHATAEGLMTAGQALQAGAAIVEGITRQIESAPKARKTGKASGTRKKG
jgi:hypothetical protein